jgi:hypothetical protein
LCGPPAPLPELTPAVVMVQGYGEHGEKGFERAQIPGAVPNLVGQLSSPGLRYPGVGDQVPLKERVRLGEITDSTRTVTHCGSRLDDRPEDGLMGLLTETLIGHD